MAALTNAEKQKAFRERQKKKLGPQEVARLKHEAYMRRKDKLKADRDKKKFAGKQIQSYLLYRDIRKQLIKMELSIIGAPEKLDQQSKDIIEVRAMKMVNLIVEHGMTPFEALKAESNNRQEINLFPALGTDFFKEVSRELDIQEKEVWEYVYLLLFWQEKVETETVENISRHSDTPVAKVVETLKKLENMGYVRLTEFDAEFTRWYLNDRFDKCYKKEVKPKWKSLFAPDFDKPSPEDIEDARQEFLRERTSWYLSTAEKPNYILERGPNWVDYDVDEGRPKFYPAVNKE